jgi:hypothetical protein
MGRYPYVAVRYMATVYGHFPVRFVDPQDSRVDADEATEAFVVACPLPFVDGRLTAQAREALLDVVQQASKRSRHRLCVVFSESDCVYCEPDGSAKTSSDPPSGGIRCVRFPVALKSS